MRIVFAGAGFTALEAAPLVKKVLPDSTVTLIAKHEHRQLAFPSELLNNHVEPLDIQQHCKQRGIECIVGTITSIDREQRIIHIGETQLGYDYLVLDMGSEPANMPQAAIPCNNRHNMLELKHHVIGQVIKAKEDSSAMYKTFVVAGTSVQSVETMAELRRFVNRLAEKHLFFPEEFTFILVTQRQHLNGRLRKILEQQQVEIYDEIAKRYIPGSLYLEDRTIETQTLVWGEHRPNTLLDGLGLVMNTACEVDKHLRTSDHKVFAAGGCATATRELTITALNRDDALILAHNLVASVTSRRMKAFKPGRSYTVSTADGKALLWTPLFSLHSGLSRSIREHYSKKHAKRIQKA